MGRFRADYNLPNIMITTFFAFYGERTDFREITFKPRTAGVNSVSLKRIFMIGLKALADFTEFRRGMKR